MVERRKERTRGERPRLPIGEAWTAAADSGPQPASLEDSPEEQARQAAILSRETQLHAQRRTRGEIGYKFSDPREDPEELQDAIDELERRIFQLDLEIQSLRASQSMRFPTANEIANLASAMNYLEARIASSAAAVALMSAADGVMTAFNL